jgi:hypothetical protein
MRTRHVSLLITRQGQRGRRLERTAHIVHKPVACVHVHHDVTISHVIERPKDNVRFPEEESPLTRQNAGVHRIVGERWLNAASVDSSHLQRRWAKMDCALFELILILIVGPNQHAWIATIRICDED